MIPNPRVYNIFLDVLLKKNFVILTTQFFILYIFLIFKLLHLNILLYRYIYIGVQEMKMKWRFIDWKIFPRTLAETLDYFLGMLGCWCKGETLADVIAEAFWKLSIIFMENIKTCDYLSHVDILWNTSSISKLDIGNELCFNIFIVTKLEY